jgi:hypothetical protein
MRGIRLDKVARPLSKEASPFALYFSICNFSPHLSSHMFASRYPIEEEDFY